MGNCGENMTGTKGNSLLETRRKNRVLIKSLIFRKRTALRTDIARELGLTLPTITTSINEMLQEGILEEVIPEDDMRTRAVGRKPTAVVFHRDAAAAVGIELGPYSSQAVLMNIRGEILRKIEKEPANEDYESMVQEVVELVREVLPSDADVHNLLGIGIGLPGFIDAENGVIRSNFRTDWIGKNLADDLEGRCGLPVLIDNNVRLRAEGCSMCAAETDPDTFAYLFISKGIACPLVFHGELLSGYSSGAGELGQTNIGIFADPAGRTEYRTVDELASERAIFERCQEGLLQGRMRGLHERMAQEGRMTIRQILDLQREGDPEIREVMAVTMEHLGVTLSNVVNFINPGYVVVDGYIMQVQENRDNLLKIARSRFYGLNEEEVHVWFADHVPERGATGAAYHVIRRLFLDI